MKGLIWFLCILVNFLITFILGWNGVTLGGIPTAILFGATIGLAKRLCKKWAEHKENQEAAKQAQHALSHHPTSASAVVPQAAEQNSVNDKINFCRECGSKLLDGAIFCNKCGAKVAKE